MEDGYSITWQQPNVPSVHLRRLAGMPGSTLELDQFITDIKTAGEALFVTAAAAAALRAKMLTYADGAPPTGFGTATIQHRTTTSYP